MKLEFKDVALDYAASDDARSQMVRALDGVSLAVPAGQAIAVIGPSGCGKTTMLRLAAGLLQPSFGQVLVDGAPLERPRQATALILQDFGLLPWKTVYQNAELGLLIRHVPAAQRRARTQAALAQVGLQDFARSYPAQLSGGMQQRLALARALALDIDVLLMDEPLSALDALLREQLQDTLLELWKRNGHAQILVTHSIEEAVYLGQRIVVMTPRPGRVATVVENLGMGAPGYRSAPEFFEVCTRVRAALAAGGEVAR